jgi:hypothetical protein
VLDGLEVSDMSIKSWVFGFRVQSSDLQMTLPQLIIIILIGDLKPERGKGYLVGA